MHLPSHPRAAVFGKAPAAGYRLVEMIPFALAHVACLGAIWTGVSLVDLLIAVTLYAVRMFGITAGYHRYFSHRGFKTSRVFAFILAFVAQSSAQRGVLWWAANHRHHHRFSDTADDVHSPVWRSFWYSHFGWFFTARHAKTDLAAVPDLAKYPELMWLDRNPYLPPILTGGLVWLFAGWSGLIVGFLWSTVALWHATFAINSLVHVIGRRRYVTGDQSRNNWWLALLTFGEGWHNNHHHYQSAACQGFRWYEIDISYYVLKALSAVGLTWDLKTPSAQVVRSELRLGRAVVEKAAAELAARFQVERISADLAAMLSEKGARLDASIDSFQADLARIIGKWRDQIDDTVETARRMLAELIDDVHLPAMPTMADLRAHAGQIFGRNPSMDDIVERARQMLIESVCEQMLCRTAALATVRA